MLGVEYARQRCNAAISEIKRLKQSEFPYSHSRDALVDLECLFREHLEALAVLKPNTAPPVLRNACSQSLDCLDTYTPILGMVLRSTNIRNAFELYSPLYRLAKTLLGNSIKLILSSEWDNTPSIYIPKVDLVGYVLIGLPAQESSNALLIPLAGHELGHNLWDEISLSKKYDASVRKTIIGLLSESLWPQYARLFPDISKDHLPTLVGQETWLNAHRLAMSQIEEVFCDVMGLRLFAEAYINAFAYAVSPGIVGERPVEYPDTRDRVEYMLQAATAIGVNVEKSIVELFDNGEGLKDELSKLFAAVADAACKAHLSDIITEATAFADKAKAPMRNLSAVAKVEHSFRLIVPAEGDATMTDIINAAWNCRHDAKLWADIKQIQADDKPRILNDLVLKSLEVLEVHERLKTP